MTTAANEADTAVSIVDRIAAYGFECEAGPLTHCVEWEALRTAHLTASRALEKILEEFDISGKPPGYVGRIFANIARASIGTPRRQAAPQQNAIAARPADAMLLSALKNLLDISEELEPGYVPGSGAWNDAKRRLIEARDEANTAVRKAESSQ